MSGFRYDRQWTPLRCMKLATILLFLTCITPGTGSVEEVGSLLPRSGEFPGWSLHGDIRLYSPDELWDPIDGEAEQYLRYGCRSLTTAEYRHEERDSEISVDIFRMKDDLSGFGIYAAQRPQDGSFLSVGTQGYGIGDGLNFFKGPYYIKLRIREGERWDEPVLPELGKIIAGRCQTKATFPDIFDIFPREKLVEHSFGYVPDGVLGIRGLTDAFSARYDPGGEQVEIFLLREKDAEKAGDRVSLARRFLEKRGMGLPKEFSIDQAVGYQGKTKYQGTVIVLRRDADILIVNGTENTEWVRRTVTTFFRNIAESNN